LNPRDILKATPFFGGVLDDAEIVMLAAKARFIGFSEGATPVEEDGPGHSMFVIVSGKASVTVAGEEEPVATLGPGAIFGEMSLLTGARRSATVTALAPLEAIEIDQAALAHVLAGSPTLVARFVDMVARRQRELDRLAGGSAWGTLRPGKAELTEMIATFYGKHGGTA